MATLHPHSHSNITKGRKRRLSEDEDMQDAQPTMTLQRSLPERHYRNGREAYRVNEVKRSKTGIQRDSGLTHMLASMDKDKLIHIVHSLFDNHPELRQDIMSYIPAPTVQSATEVLHALERRMTESVPYNRNGPLWNDYTFSRVRTPFIELMDTIRQYAYYFTSPLIFGTTSFSFLQLATALTHRLPSWENDDNNQLKRDLYNDLNSYWTRAIQMAASRHQEGEVYSAQTVNELAKHLAYHNNAAEGLFTGAVNEFSKSLGTLMNPVRDVPICHHPAVEHTITRLASPPRVVGYADARR
ncbi:predicted protein [Lichtheimia corymbifera JMRC:FSU:9682]|uniref:Tethering factor for nuclear proteasome STS1 n=1 Tax=Lichtheimia corymbifera JMRC:FSU:9682 TaxID=1263082 RepID=A0A068S4K8_9FUNG|nr:predicted protein [Lichtheimia corymbifera JMRC:FSU:9682]